MLPISMIGFKILQYCSAQLLSPLWLLPSGQQYYIVYIFFFFFSCKCHHVHYVWAFILVSLGLKCPAPIDLSSTSSICNYFCNSSIITPVLGPSSDRHVPESSADSPHPSFRLGTHWILLSPLLHFNICSVDCEFLAGTLCLLCLLSLIAYCSLRSILDIYVPFSV